MSHFSKIKTQIINQDLLIQAFDDLKYQYKTGKDLIVSGHQGQELVDILVKTSYQEHYLIGFRKTETCYECIADWWEANVNHSEFLAQVQQRYAYHAARQKLEAQGFSLVKEQQEDQRLHLRLRRMV